MANELKILIGADGKPLTRTLAQLQTDLSAFNKQLKTAFDSNTVANLNKNITETQKNISLLKGFGVSAFSGLAPSAQSAAFALQNVGRVAQDLPFGFIGIQNNLNPLLESFARLKQETGSTSGALRAMAASLGGIGGLGFVLSLVSSGITIFQNGISGFNKKTKEAADKGREFADSVKSINEVIGQAAGSVQGQIDNVQALASAISNTNNSYDERKRALQELQSINKSYFGDLTLEASKLSTLATRVQDYTNAILAEAVTKGFKDEISKVTQEINTQSEVYKKLQKAAADAQTAQDNFKGPRTAIIDPRQTGGITVLNDAFLTLEDNTSDANEALSAQGSLIDDLQGKYAQLREGLNSSVTELIKFKSTDNPEKTKKATDALKERINVLKELVDAGVNVHRNQLELRGLEIKVFLRDASVKSITEQEKQEFIDSKLNNLKFSTPVSVVVPLSVAFSVTEADPAGDNLEQGITRMTNRLEAAGKKAGEKAKKSFTEPLDNLGAQINSIIGNSLASVGEAIGDIFSGADPAAAAINLIGTSLQGLGKALIAYGLAAEAVKDAIATIFANPFTAIAVGIAAIAAGAALKATTSNPPRLAEGGITQGPTLAMIGEAGREVVMPLDKLSSIIGDRSDSMKPIESFIRGEDIVTIWKKVTKKNARKF